MTEKRNKSEKNIVRSDRWFFGVFMTIIGLYVILILSLLLADSLYMFKDSTLTDNPMIKALMKPEIRYSIQLTLYSCTAAALLATLVAIPASYMLARKNFWGKSLIDAILDIPIVLPPLVIGLSLLILFGYAPFRISTNEVLHFLSFGALPEIGFAWANKTLNELIVYQIPAVILAQFTVSAAFAIRTMKATFDQVNFRREEVALTLGCSRPQAFFLVTLPEVRKGVLTSFSIAWARALGEFGPLLIFAGATRNKTEVLSTSVFLEMSIGDLEAAVAVSLIMVLAAIVVLTITRVWGNREEMGL